MTNDIDDIRLGDRIHVAASTIAHAENGRNDKKTQIKNKMSLQRMILRKLIFLYKEYHRHRRW